MNGDLVLVEQHTKFLRDRGVADDVAAERGYQSASRKADLEKLGFGRTQQLVTALVIPVHSGCRTVEVDIERWLTERAGGAMSSDACWKTQERREVRSKHAGLA